MIEIAFFIGAVILLVYLILRIVFIGYKISYQPDERISIAEADAMIEEDYDKIEWLINNECPINKSNINYSLKSLINKENSNSLKNEIIRIIHKYNLSFDSKIEDIYIYIFYSIKEEIKYSEKDIYNLKLFLKSFLFAFYCDFLCSLVSSLYFEC